MGIRINWFGLAGGVMVFLAIVASFFVPWWQLTIGDNLVNAKVSPLSTNFNVLGSAFTIPLIWVLNIVGLLAMIFSGVAMLIYSIVPTKSFSNQLLSFGYKKPLFTVLFFVIILFALTAILQAALNITVPISGSATSTARLPFVSGTTIEATIVAQFQWSFWVAAVAAGLCLAARLYHGKVAAVPHV
jgi:hypothetical protein